MKHTFWIIILFLFQQTGYAQDPFFTHFYGNESTYNPALTGYRGALSVIAKHKAQWPGLGEAHFRTSNLLYEESLPCSIFDWGLSAKSDREGEGLFKTMDFGFMESVWWVFKSLWDKKLVYKSTKVMPFSTALGTVLSNFEAGQNYQTVPLYYNTIFHLLIEL